MNGDRASLWQWLGRWASRVAEDLHASPGPHVYIGEYRRDGLRIRYAASVRSLDDDESPGLDGLGGRRGMAPVRRR